MGVEFSLMDFLKWARPQSHWNAHRKRRETATYTPRGRARCEDCGTKLHYDYGSIAWSVRKKDHCSECWAKKAVADSFKDCRP